jgi:membrane fusion protein (multidrug efflux system)
MVMSFSRLLKPRQALRFIRGAARSLAVGALVVGSLASCSRKPAGAPPGMGGPQGPMEVGVITVEPKPVTLTQDLPARTAAYRVAEVRARVNGIVQKRLFNEGADVKEGQLLYQIDPAPYQAELDNALGMLNRAEANAEASRVKEKRYSELAGSKVVSKQDYDDVAVTSRTNQAEVLSARAAVQTARINLSYTQVTSPLSGRAGMSQVTEGAYVQASAATLFVTVQQLDPMYVDVSQSSNELLRLKKALANGELSVDEAGQARVKLLLDDGAEYAREGTLQFSDVSVNPSTSSVTIRAVFPNPENLLLPGMFVRARLVEGRKQDALLLPQFTVTRNSKGEATAFVVGPDDKAELRVLKADRAVGNQWLITDGLKAGDRVIANNLQRLRPGAPVKAVPYAPESPAKSTASAAR